MAVVTLQESSSLIHNPSSTANDRERHLTALILAGGYGTRLSPITRDAHPKHLHKIANKTLLEYTLEPFRTGCVDDIVLLLGNKASMIVEYFRDDPLKYLVTEKPAGIIPEMKEATARFRLHGDIIIAEGDSIRRGLDVEKLYNQHINSDALSTVVATSRTMKNAANFHGVIFNDANQVIGIRQPNDDTVNNHPLVGAVVLAAEAVDLLNAESGGNSWSGIMSSLQGFGRMYAYSQGITYFNVNTPEDFFEAEEYLKSMAT